MNPSHPQPNTHEKWCEAVIGDRLGDISSLPQALVAYIRQIYTDFTAAYLNMLRQRQKKSPDWFPPTTAIDAELVDDMRHFFSDYQHITQAFIRLNTKVDRLHKLDGKRQPHLYQDAVDDILRPRDHFLNYRR